MVRRIVIGVLACAFASVMGCGLSLSGELSSEADASVPPNGDDGSTSASDGSVSTNDGGTDLEAGPLPPTCQTDACALPAGGTDFGVVLYGDRSAPCPAGFDTEDLIEKPTPQAGACVCSTACVMTGTDCNQGNIASTYGSTNTCSNNGANHQANNGNCRVQSGQFGTWAAMQAPAAVPGTCTAPATAVKTAFTTTAIRTCKPQSSTCAAELCTPPASLKACSIHLGEVTCPPQAPNRHFIAPDFNATCANCGCSITATCGGTFATYANNDCTGQTKSLQAGVCTNMNGFAFQSTKWTGTIASQTCTMQAAPVPTVALVGSKTVCCP